MKKEQIYELLMYFFGCFLPILVNIYCFDFKISKSYFILLLSLTILIFYFLCIKLNMKKGILFLIFCLVVSCFLTYDKIKIGSMHIYNVIIDEYANVLRVYFDKFSLIIYSSKKIESSTFLVLCYLSLFAIILQMYSLVIKKSHFFTFIVTLIISFPVLIVQIKLNWFLVIGLYVYWVFLLMPAKITTVKIQFRQMVLLGLSVVLCMNFVLFNFSEYKFKENYSPNGIQNTIIDKVNQVIRYFSSIQYQNSDVDLNLATNRYYADILHLKVQRKNADSLYLKTYAGAIYEDNKWKILPIETYEKKPKLFEKLDWIHSYEINDETIEYISVEDMRKGNPYSVLPYYLRDAGQTYKMNFDYSYYLDKPNTVFQVWNINHVNSFQSHDEEYSNFIKINYSSVPKKIERFFGKMSLKSSFRMKADFNSDHYNFDSNDLYFNQDYINYVSSYVRSILKQYTYTLKPGGTPDGEDFVEYFLAKNKKGYCVHFATVATLMFRYYGIPARYVEGYYVSDDAFDENGCADVMDHDAHAWVEVFDLQKGWYPIEVTVGSQQTNPLPINPNPTPQPQPTPNPEKPDSPNPQPKPTPDPEKPNDIPQKNETFDFSKYYLLITFLSVMIVYIVIRLTVLCRRKRKFTQNDRQQAVYDIYQYLLKIDGISLLTQEMFMIFEKNKFSQHKVTEEEYQLILNQTNDIVHQLYQDSSIIHKFIMKYLRFWI